MRRRQRQAGQQRRRRFLGQAREGRRAASRHQVLGPLRGVRPPAAHEGVQGRRRARADRQRAGRHATLFKQGAHQILDPKFKDGTYKRVAEQAVPDWDNQRALTIFEQMLQRTSNKIDGVLAANDGLANAAISALKARRLAQIPITGQDATLQGIQNIVTGDQCMTVYKPIQQEVDAAAKLATALAKNQTPTGVTASTDNGSKKVPSILLKPISVTKSNIKQYFGRADFPARAQVCAGRLASACTTAGV